MPIFFGAFFFYVITFLLLSFFIRELLFFFDFFFPQNKECVNARLWGPQNIFNFWGERSTPEYLLPKRNFGTRTRVVSAKGVRFAHGFVFAPQNFFIGWGRLTACIAGHAIQRKNPQDESQRFSKWRLPPLPQYSAVQYHRRCCLSALCPLSAALAPLRSAVSRLCPLSHSLPRPLPRAAGAHSPHPAWLPPRAHRTP